MTGSGPGEVMRDVVREVLRELMPGMLDAAPALPRVNRHRGTGSANGEGNPAGHTGGHSGQDRAGGDRGQDRAGGDRGQDRAGGDRSQDRAGGDRGTGDDAVIVPEVPAPPVAAVLRPSTWTGPTTPGEVIGDGSPMRWAEPQLNPTSPVPSPASPAVPVPMPASPAVPVAQGLGPRGASAGGHGLAARAAPSPGLASDTQVRAVTIDTNEDLEGFVRELVALAENPRDRLSIRAGRLRFALRRSALPPVAARSAADGLGTAQDGVGTAPDAGQITAARVVKGAVTERTVRAAAADGARLVLARGAVLTPLARDRASALGVDIERERRC